MKLVSYIHQNKAGAGVLNDAGLIASFHALGIDADSMNAFMDLYDQKGEALLTNLRQAEGVTDTIPQQDARLLSPFPHPRQDFICVGLNYLDHAAETGRYLKDQDAQLPQHPVFFSKRANRALGTGEPIPAHTGLVNDLDYEAELAVIIGKTAHRVPEEKAQAYILGYAIANDISARAIQNRHRQWYVGKSLDGFALLGPWITTADEVPYPPDLGITCHVNGEKRQDSRTSRMIFNVGRLIASLTEGMTLLPGTVILTGTPAGVGMGNPDNPRFLKPGDTVRCEIERLGTLENTVA